VRARFHNVFKTHGFSRCKIIQLDALLRLGGRTRPARTSLPVPLFRVAPNLEDPREKHKVTLHARPAANRQLQNQQPAQVCQPEARGAKI
jgi:hypothetical protein